MTDQEVERLLTNLAIQSFETRDEQEVAGYAELMDLVFSSWQDIPFDENHVKQLHQILLRHSEKDSRHRGQYKTHTNSVAAFDENGVQIGREAARILLDRMNKDSKKALTKISIPPTLIVRETTAKVKSTPKKRATK